MSDSLGDMFVRFGGDTRQFDASMRHIQGQLNQIQSQSSRGGIGDIFGGITLSNIAMGVFNQILNIMNKIKDSFVFLVSEGMKFNSVMEQNETAFKVMLGSMTESKDLMSSIRDFAAATPLETGDLTQGTKLLLGYNVAAENVLPALRMIGDVAQGDKQKMMSLGLAFGQVMANGRLMGQEVLQMVNAGFNPLQQISEDTGKSMVSLRKDMENGAVSATMVAQAFINATSEGGLFYKAMEEQSKTMSGRLSTLRDDFKKFLGDTVKPVFDYIKDVILPATIQAFNMFSMAVKTAIASLRPAFNNLYQAFTMIENTVSNVIGRTTPWFQIFINAGWFMLGEFVSILNGLTNHFKKVTAIVTNNINSWVSASRASRAIIGMNFEEAGSHLKDSVGYAKEATKAFLELGSSFSEGYSEGKKLYADKTNEVLAEFNKMKATGGKFDYTKAFNLDKVANSSAEGLKKVKDKIADQMKSILGEIKSKAESIRDAFDIFSSPKMEKLSWKDLRYRMQKQLQMMEQWKAAMDKIGQRMGRESEIYRATLAQGPQAVGQAMALASMPDEFLNRFSDQYKQKQSIGLQFAAQQQAWQMKADNINNNITFNITEASDSDKIVQEITKKFKLVGVM